MNPANSKPIGELGHASKGDLDKAWPPPTRASRPGARCRPSSAARSCARPPIWCAPAPTRSPRCSRMEQGKVLAEAKLEVHQRRRHHRLVRRRGPARLRPHHPGPRRRRAQHGDHGADRRRWPASRPGISRSRRPCARSRRRWRPAARSSSSARRRRRARRSASSSASTTPACRRACINLVYGVPAEISEYLIPHPDHPQDLVHRLGAGRQAPERAGRQPHEARHHGARRPRAGAGVRRRRRRAARPS